MLGGESGRALRVESWGDPSILVTEFPDIEDFHGQLIETILRLEQDPNLTRHFDGHVGESKVYHVERWNCAAARLIDARARALFTSALKKDDAVVDLSWASIYRAGNYCLPHSHFRSAASLVYFLDLGDEGAGGRFLFTDPRLKICCKHEPGRMTSPVGPQVRPGVLMMFPAQCVHMVTPYHGTRPRITMSWNIDDKILPGNPLLS